MAANLYIGSYDVVDPEGHLYLIYDPNTDNDDNFATDNSGIRILRGGPGENYGLPLNLNLIVELREDPEDSVDWGEAITSTNLTSIDASIWSSIWSFAHTMGNEDDPSSELYSTELLYGFFGPNSNTVINTVLNIAGINLRDALPIGTIPVMFPGHMDLADGSGDSSYTAFIHETGLTETTTFHKRDGNDTIVLQHDEETERHAELALLNSNDSTGLTIVQMNGLKFADVEFEDDGDNLKVTMGSNPFNDDLVRVIDFYADRSDNASEGAYTTAFDFIDYYYRHGDANANTFDATGLTKKVRLEGFGGVDVLTGGSDDDVLLGGVGNDTLNGGSGSDTADYSTAAAGVTVNLSLGTASNDGDGGADTLTSIENVRGSSSNDTLTGSTGDNIFYGSADDDTINGGSGNNEMSYEGFEEKVNAAFSSLGIAILKGAAGVLGEDTISNVTKFVGSAYADTFTGSLQNNGIADLILEGGEGSDGYVFNLTNESGTVHIKDQLAYGLDTITIQNFDAGTMETSFYNNGNLLVLMFASDWNTTTLVYDTLFQIYIESESAIDYSGVELFKLGSQTYLLSDISAYADYHVGGQFDHTELSQVSDYAAGGWQGVNGAAGGLKPTFDGSGNITSVQYAPTSTGNYVPYRYGTEVWHPGIITFISSNHLTIESSLKAVNFHDGISIDDVRLTLTGSQGNTSLVINLDDFGESFTIPFFEAGETITGIAPYGGVAHSWVQGSSAGSFASSGGGVYSGTFTNGASLSLSGSYSDTFFLEALNFYNGTINTLGNLTFEGTNSSDTLKGLDNRGDTIIGYNGNDTLYGYGGNDTLEGGAGNDNLQGGAGDDTYVFAVGAGGDTITEAASSGADTIRMNGYDANDVRLRTSSTGTLFITSRANVADEISFSVGKTNFSGTTSELAIPNVEQIIFDDGTLILTSGLPLEGTSGNDSIYGTQYNDQIKGMDGGDNLYGNRGNDTLEGGTGNDNLYGGAGDDTYNFSAGFGGDEINEVASAGADKIRMSGYDADDVRLTTNSGGTLFITSKASASDEILISVGKTNFAGTTSEMAIPNVEQIVFDDTTLSLTGGLLLEGTSANNSLYGTQYNDEIRGMDGGDNLYGNRGNDTLIGGAGSDNIYGGDGNDLLYGGAGTNSMTGGAGADHFIFEAATAFDTSDAIADFSTAQVDVIDVANLLSGYDPLTDLISDFVRMTDNGSRTTVLIDQDGGANAFVQIATLTGVTNIAAGATATEGELQTLIANGMLIAA